MNPFELLKNMPQIQAKMKDFKEKLKDIRIVGFGGGDMVQIELNGEQNIQSVKISKEAVDPNDVSLLEDLVLAAFVDAQIKLKEKLQTELSSLTGGMNIPPGFMGL